MAPLAALATYLSATALALYGCFLLLGGPLARLLDPRGRPALLLNAALGLCLYGGPLGLGALFPEMVPMVSSGPRAFLFFACQFSALFAGFLILGGVADRVGLVHWGGAGGPRRWAGACRRWAEAYRLLPPAAPF